VSTKNTDDTYGNCVFVRGSRSGWEEKEYIQGSSTKETNKGAKWGSASRLVHGEGRHQVRRIRVPTATKGAGKKSSKTRRELVICKGGSESVSGLCRWAGSPDTSCPGSKQRGARWKRKMAGLDVFREWVGGACSGRWETVSPSPGSKPC